ncbi:MAG: DPP IV N-terminal domain-containing protein, partial [Elusimicrobiota bacterium]|nr:DPP IV N-terminal domain-containing protein [Elusimicrobiota bacterium]
CVMNSDGSNKQVFLPTTGKLDWYNQPDGTPYDGEVVFHRMASGQYGIYKWSAESGMQYLVYSDTHPAPAWSPDKSKIAYRGDDNNVWIVNSDGTNRIRLTGDGSVVPYCTIDWSPDGDKIIFVRQEGGGRIPIKWFLWIMDVDGTNQVKLIEGLFPSWSMNGSKISFNFMDDVYVMVLKPDNPGIQQLSLTQQIKPDTTFRQGEAYSYPNPAKNGKNPKIHIECGVADKVNFDIYDIAGQKVDSTEMTGMPNVIWQNKYAYEYPWDISDVASGIYVYTVNAIKVGEKNIKTIGRVAIIK